MSVDPLGPLYGAVVDAAAVLEEFAMGINYADAADPATLPLLGRTYADQIAPLLQRIEELLAQGPDQGAGGRGQATESTSTS